MAQSVGGSVGALDRVVTRLVESNVPLRRADLLAEARRIVPQEAPLAGPDLAEAVVDSLIGMGPLERLLNDPAVTDVLVNSPDDIWVEREGRLHKTGVVMPGEAAIVAAVERMIAPLGLRLDRASPAVDARLPDGSRLHAVIPPASVDGPVVAIRRFTPVVPDLAALVECGGIRQEGAEQLKEAVVGRVNLLVSGGTGSGKTTLLNVLSGEIPPHERVVTIEDSAELRRQAGSEAAQRRGSGRDHSADSGPSGAADAAGPDCGGGGPGARGPRFGPGDEHRSRRVDGHRSRQRHRRSAVAARDAGRLGRAPGS